MTERSVRNGGVTIGCPVCGQPFTRVGRQQVCSAACRQAAWRRRHATPPVALPRRAAPAATVYECPSCDTRYLGQQRCADCGVFCGRVGPGGLCPHCDEPVALTDLLPIKGGATATLERDAAIPTTLAASGTVENSNLALTAVHYGTADPEKWLKA